MLLKHANSTGYAQHIRRSASFVAAFNDVKVAASQHSNSINIPIFANLFQHSFTVAGISIDLFNQIRSRFDIALHEVKCCQCQLQLAPPVIPTPRNPSESKCVCRPRLLQEWGFHNVKRLLKLAMHVVDRNSTSHSKLVGNKSLADCGGCSCCWLHRASWA